ncbi:MAG: glycosyltransferase [Leptolyngbya sp. Prado105]|jgi:cellulose synthase/poly-beta-1,6-N-acetylglucosamine synthase-like glycosyltransferase|nr:glycosyltransferase [Leptolyngbya sp. Prado105]
MLNACIFGLAFIFLALSYWTFLETLNALLFRGDKRSYPVDSSARVAILVPAHNEEIGIAETLATLNLQKRVQDHIIVIADNCVDETATISRSMGVTVLERFDSVRYGKGYALDYGVRHLAVNPPDIVLVIDADCQIQVGTIDALVNTAMATKRAVQATYLMNKPVQATAKHSVAAFAFTMKNLVRPLGLARMGLPCLLMGTGMAFPWQAIQAVNLASGHIVEDMKLSVDLTIAGFAPVYCPEARVIGVLPQNSHAGQTQRTRWEHGHLQAIVEYVPVLVKAAIQRRKLDALGIALELSVPPLSLYVMSWIAMSLISVGWGVLSGNWLAAMVAIAAGVCLVTTILGSWAKFGREDLPMRELIAIPLYVLWKIPMYLKFVVRPQKSWVRTERDARPVSE